jgi:hypothetical protein
MKPIPAGWYEIGRREIIFEGDKFWSNYSRDWSFCQSSIGNTPDYSFDHATPVIRKGQPLPIEKQPDKEWLNPWD